MTARVGLIVQRELATSLQSRWFFVYSGIVLAAGVILATLGLSDFAIHGYRGLAKAFAGLVHLALLFVPLLALFPATAAITEDRESGALEYVLAQPVSFGEVFAGKWGGVSAALLLALTAGFGVAGAVAALRGVPPGLLVALYGFVVLLALAFVSVGLLCSVVSESRARATTMGIVVWLVLVALGTLGIMVAFVRWGLPETVLAVWTFVNPVEAFRIGVLSILDPDLSLLGPVGAGIVTRVGSAGTAGLAAVALSVWVVAPALLGWWRFARGRI